MKRLSEEQAFNLKLEELGLRVQFSEEEKVDYGVTLHRLTIMIYKGNTLLQRTTGGFRTKNSYRECGFIEGNRRLQTIELRGDHKE